MKKSVPPAAIVAAVIVVLLVIGFAAFKTFGGDPNANVSTPEQAKAQGTMRQKVLAAHRDANGHFVDDQGHPIDFSMAPSGH
jgi:hypothetical protein